MDSFHRNALRISLAGAGIVVLGASYVGQASADEATTPEPTSVDSTSPAMAPTVAPTADELLAPDSLDTLVIPTVSDMTGL